MNSDRVVIRRALIGVADKAGVADFARALERHGVEIVSTGGTMAALQAAGVKVRSVESFTGSPEMLDGRVKTLHPKIHGAILARRGDESHQRQMLQHRIEPIDLVVVNFYPFEKTVAKSGVSLDEAIENIDIGGPALVRAAAKNHGDVAVVVDAADYAAIAAELDSHQGAISADTRWRLARKAFARVTAYDAAISNYLGTHTGDGGELGARRDLQPCARARTGAALRRESASDRRAVRPLPRDRASASRQGIVVQQRGRYQLGDEPDAGVRGRAARGGGDPEAQHAVRRGRRRYAQGGVGQGVRNRSGLAVRRHHHREPAVGHGVRARGR